MNNDILIDITMTATCRPAVLQKTLDSFYVNMFKPIIDRCRIIINVDPVGENVPSYEVAQIAPIYFRRYIIGLPMKPSFPDAFAWCWNKASAPWVFNLEDDWELLVPVDIFAMIGMMQKFPQLASLRIPWFRSTENSMKNWNLHFPWNGHFFECPYERRKAAGFAGHPSLLRGQFVKNCAPLIKTNMNPEKQFHGDNELLVNEVLKWEYGVWGKPNQHRMLTDIGAVWKKNNGFRKAGNKAFFTEWIPVELTESHKMDDESHFDNEHNPARSALGDKNDI
jgi:hypothetical protein